MPPDFAFHLWQFGSESLFVEVIGVKIPDQGEHMPTALPLGLFSSWAFLFVFVLGQAHYEREIERGNAYESPRTFKALQISNGIGLLVGLAILIYYGICVPWYWAIARGVGGSVAGGALLGLFRTLFGARRIAKSAFYMWPLIAAGLVARISLL